MMEVWFVWIVGIWSAALGFGYGFLAALFLKRRQEKATLKALDGLCADLKKQNMQNQWDREAKKQLDNIFRFR